MKVLVIPSWYPMGEDKLMGIYHKEFCEALSKRNIEVVLFYIAIERLNAPLKYLFMKKKEKLKENGYKVYIRRMLNLNKISLKLHLNRYYKRLEKLYLEYVKKYGKPDIIHAQVTIPAGYCATKLGKKEHIPVVVTEHASYFKSFFDGENKKYGEYVLNNAYFTTVSKYMLKELPLNNNFQELPNLVDTASFKFDRKPIKDLRIVQICAFRKGKRVEDLLEALKIIKEKKIDFKATIVGDGYLEDYYKRICKELDLDKYVDFVGRKTKEEVKEILKKHNILVITSEQETFGIPGIEALASGIPVVSTKCLGPEEYIDNKCGKLVSKNDIKGLAKAIIEVYKNLDNYDINYLREVADKYSAQNITNRAIKIYDKLLREK